MWEQQEPHSGTKLIPEGKLFLDHVKSRLPLLTKCLQCADKDLQYTVEMSWSIINQTPSYIVTYLQFVPREFFHVSTTELIFSIPVFSVDVSRQLLLNHNCLKKLKYNSKISTTKFSTCMYMYISTVYLLLGKAIP